MAIRRPVLCALDCRFRRMLTDAPNYPEPGGNEPEVPVMAFSCGCVLLMLAVVALALVTLLAMIYGVTP